MAGAFGAGLPATAGGVTIAYETAALKESSSMPLFDYTGQTQSGATFEGTIGAESRDQAAQTLMSMGVRITSLRRAARAAYVAPLSLDDLLFFNEQVASMAKSGIPLHEGLRQLAADVGSGKLKRLLLDLAEDLAAGTPVEQAIEKQRARFPADYASVVKAGLRTGDLGGTLYGVTAHLRLKSQFRRVLIELGTYPLLVLSLSLVILSFFMSSVMPKILDILREFGAEAGLQLPPSVRLIGWLTSAWPVLQLIGLVLVALLFAVGIVLLWPGAKNLRERVLRRVPGFASVYWLSILARFTHTSALAAYTGAPLPELVTASGAASGSPALARATRRVGERLESGQTLEAAAGQESDVPALWRYVVQTAAERGGLAGALEELARSYELRAQQWVGTLRILLGPFLMLILAFALGSVLVLVFTTLATILNLVSALTGLQ